MKETNLFIQESQIKHKPSADSLPPPTSVTSPVGLAEENLWTPRMVADRAGYRSPVSVLRAWRAGKLRGFKLNPRVVRFAPADVQAWIAAARV